MNKVQHQIVLLIPFNIDAALLALGYFHVKIVRGKILSSLGVSDENFSTMKYFAHELNA